MLSPRSLSPANSLQRTHANLIIRNHHAARNGPGSGTRTVVARAWQRPRDGSHAVYPPLHTIVSSSILLRCRSQTGGHEDGKGGRRLQLQEGTAGARAREEYAESVSGVQAAEVEARCDVEDNGQVQGQVDLARGHRVAAHNGIHLEHGSVTAVRVVEALAYRRLPCWPCG